MREVLLERCRVQLRDDLKGPTALPVPTIATAVVSGTGERVLDVVLGARLEISFRQKRIQPVQVVEMRQRRKAKSNKGAAPDRGHGAVRAKSATSRSGRGG
jgi:hypothetical protein